jgi:hypothetical protein
MAKFKIKIRPKGKFDLSKEMQDCLTWYVLSGCRKEEAFCLFVRPDLSEQKSLLSSCARQLFASRPAVAYLRAYRSELGSEPLEDEQGEEGAVKEYSAKESEAKKARATKAIEQWAYSQAESIKDLDKDAVTILLKALDQLGLFDDASKAVEKPRRYLPDLCQTQCRYRLFCEQHTADGDILDECDYCKAKKFAVDNGFKYDAATLLDIPTEKLKEYGLENYTIVENK